MSLDDRARDHEPEARARNRAPGRRRGAVEAREQLADLVAGDADAGVGDLDAYAVSAVRGRQHHRAALGSELERVRDEVVEHLPEASGVSVERDVVRDVE